jgi:predicted GH43/DUF377 family glycosyl hydrolase
MEAKRELAVKRLPVRISHDERRVITRFFTFEESEQLQTIIGRVKSLDSAAVDETLRLVLSRFEGRHVNLLEAFERNYQQVKELTGLSNNLSDKQRLLMGSYFTMEYALEATALFNPSIVPHPNQDGLEEGELRFIMSLRATGEGHVSSVVFRGGVIDADGNVRLSTPSRFPRAMRLAPDQRYHKRLFRRSLLEMSVRMGCVDRILEPLADEFTMCQLQQRIQDLQQEHRLNAMDTETVQAVLWLARSNYQLQVAEDADISELTIFPRSESEAHGIEDVRLVRFVDDDGQATYYGTYSAYSGFRVLPMMLETKDFRRIEVLTLNGDAARNKGLALFPRRVKGHYAMCSRIDGQNLYVMYSDMPHFWESAKLIARPKYPWELMLMGNCGSPIETSEGWLLITHGVGPMRRYCISAMLLDLDDPTKIIGRLQYPILAPTDEEREGYVPNVVYSCGSLVHRGQLFLPFSMADRTSTMGTIPLDVLIAALKRSPA